MKLFYFSGSTIPSTFANSVHVMKMCAAFSKAGHNVTLFGKGQGGAKIFDQYAVPNNFKLALAPQINIRKIGGFIRLAYTLLKSKTLGKPDLIYGRDLWTLSAISNTKKPIVLELHEIPPKGNRSEKLLKKILNAHNLLGIVVISEGLKQDLLSFHPFAEEKILVAHDGADLPLEELIPIDLKTPPNTEYQIGYGGSLYPGKGIEIIISIAEAMPNIGFHIFGGPNSELDKWKNSAPPTNIIFYGHIDQKSLQAHLSVCDALIAPYMAKIKINTGADIARWISPLKLFEYMALNKPILCSDIPALHETMEHKQNCLMAPPEDIAKWCQNITDLKNSPNLANEISKNAFQDLVTKYSWDIRAKNILQFLQKLSQS